MYKYVLKRLLMLIPVIIGVSFLVFFIMSLSPGDPARTILGETAPIEAVEALREELAAALARQYGPVQGQLAYEHLEALLTPPPVQEAAAPSPAPENKAASKPGKRRSRAAAKPAETAEPAPAQSAPQDAEEPAGTAEPAAPAARSRRSGASRRRKRAERSKAEKA